MLKKFILLNCSIFSLVSLFAQSGNCDCFETRILTIQDSLSNCYYYEIEVWNNGDCRYGLSNFTMGIECGTVSNAWNSLDTQMELNFTDPKNGLSGFKVDNISDFGESNQPDSFQVGFFLCIDETDEECYDILDAWEPVVAYKAGKCLIYDTLGMGGTGPIGPPVVKIAPNPADDIVHLSIELSEEGPISFGIVDVHGNTRLTPFETMNYPTTHLEQSIDVSALKPGLYFYFLQSNQGVTSGRLLIR